MKCPYCDRQVPMKDGVCPHCKAEIKISTENKIEKGDK